MSTSWNTCNIAITEKYRDRQVRKIQTETDK